MKKLLILLVLTCAIPAATTSCSTAPSSRVNQVQTLKIVGTSAKASVDAAAQLLKQGQITLAQWQSVANFYDTRWQPAFTLAVAAAQADLSSAASPDLLSLAGQLATLVAQFTTKTP